MRSSVAKQFMPLGGKPLIWHALQAVEQSGIIDDCILVTGAEDIPRMLQEVVKRYHFQKVDRVIPGGAERYDSVANAMKVIAAGSMRIPNQDGYVFIHDGARPFLTEELLRDTHEAVQEFHACVAAVPSKDTIKLADGDGFATATPDRKLVWSVQTPQVFDTKLIVGAYRELLERREELSGGGVAVTDDASVVELFTDVKVKLVKSSYENIKITTPEDIAIAESLLQIQNAHPV